MKCFLVGLSSVIIRFIGYSLRMTLDDRGAILQRSEHPPVIIAFWHNRTALMPFFHERYRCKRPLLTFISRSRDGQYTTDVAARFGVQAVRGSSSRHGTSALLGAIRAAADQKLDLAITPDGPRGPRYKIRPGLLRLAQSTGRPIVAVTYDLKWKLHLKSWDRFHVPIPFSKCRLITSEPVFVPENISEDELAVIGVRVTEALGGD